MAFPSAVAKAGSKYIQKPTIQSSILLLCDIQNKFGVNLPNIERVVSSSKFLMQCSFALDIPVIATEQYPKVFGKTRDELAQSKTMIFEKTKFSMLTEEVSKQLEEEKREDVILTGIEGHICVLQTTLDLLAKGYTVHLCVDAIDSQRSIDKEIAIQRMSQSGAILTTSESVVFQLLSDSKHPKFKELQPFVKEHITDITKIEEDKSKL